MSTIHAPEVTTAPEQVLDDAPEAAAAPEPPVATTVTEEDMLVEDVSIDGMCGVY